MRKKLICSLIVICILPSLAGCGRAGTIYSNYREVEQLQLVRAMGIDSESGDVRLTISSGELGEDGNSMLLSRSGASLELATNSLQDYAAGQELFYDHTQYFLFGQAAAEDGVEEFLDYIERSTTLPMGISLFVVRGGSAEDLMTASGDGQYDPGKALSSIKRVAARRGDNHVFSCADTARALSENGAGLICALRPSGVEGTVFTSDTGAEAAAVPDGFGILRDGKLVGFAEPDEAMAAVMLIDGGMSDIVIGDGDGGRVTLTLESSDVSVFPVWDADGSLERVRAEIKVSSRLVETSQYHDTADREFLARLGGGLARELHRRFSAMLELENEYRADFLGLGDMLRDKDAARFDAMPRGWDGLLGGVDFSVHVSAKVGRTSDLKGSVSVDGEGEFGDSGK